MAQDSIYWMQAFFSSTFTLGESHFWRPLTDVYRTRNGWLIKYELAGVLPQDVILTVEGNRITVAGKRRDCSLEEGCAQYRMEISYSPFERTIELPENIAHAHLDTKFHHGMLLVRVSADKETRR